MAVNLNLTAPMLLTQAFAEGMENNKVLHIQVLLIAVKLAGNAPQPSNIVASCSIFYQHALYMPMLCTKCSCCYICLCHLCLPCQSTHLVRDVKHMHAYTYTTAAAAAAAIAKAANYIAVCKAR